MRRQISRSYIAAAVLATIPIALPKYAFGCRVGHDPPSCWTHIHNDDVVKIAVPPFLPLPRPVKNAERKVIGDVLTAGAKAPQQTGNTLKKAVHDTADAGNAVGRFVNRQVVDYKNNTQDAVHKIRHGQVIDGLWESAISPYKSTEQNAGKAVQESPLLNTVGQVASSVYGGPAGAAAYAAWSTYNLTGDPKLALRAGVIVGGASLAMQGVAKMPVSTDSEIVRKAAVAGAIGGLAVAAAHGTNKDIKDGALKSAAMILIQVGYQKFTNTPLDAKTLTATKDGYCMMSSGADCSPPDYVLVKDENGKVLYGDPTKFHPGDQVANYVGLQVDKDTTSGFKFWVSERSPALSTVGKVPPWNAMALAHDKLVIEYNLSAPASVATIPPAVVITYAGTGASVYSSIESAVVNSANTHPAPGKAAVTTPAASKSYTVAVCADPKNVDPKKPNVLTKITVDFLDGKTSQPVCKVTEETPKGLTHPWHSSHDTEDCARRAIDLTAQLTHSGLACLAP